MTTPPLKVIECTPTHQKYLRAFSSALSNAQSTGKTDLPKIVLLSVKCVTTHRYKNKSCIKREEIEQHFQFIELTRQFVMLLTPRQFVNLFPIEKSYDGEKYMVKDYLKEIRQRQDKRAYKVCFKKAWVYSRIMDGLGAGKLAPSRF